MNKIKLFSCSECGFVANDGFACSCVNSSIKEEEFVSAELVIKFLEERIQIWKGHIAFSKAVSEKAEPNAPRRYRHEEAALTLKSVTEQINTLIEEIKGE